MAIWLHPWGEGRLWQGARCRGVESNQRPCWMGVLPWTRGGERMRKAMYLSAKAYQQFVEDVIALGGATVSYAKCEADEYGRLNDNGVAFLQRVVDRLGEDISSEKRADGPIRIEREEG